MTKWISVKDRLPEFGELVLTYNPTTKYDSQRIMVSTLKSNYINDPDTGRPLFLVKVLNPFGLGGYLHDVSHWQPLPEPPSVMHKEE
ncbi:MULTISPECIES: DUF551 domain-containing protein [Oligella]|uniref:DUF551 domain-containing protein n=1 Tax=Oligella urethralis DNF00040 TaxID=1401065 RepID=A0A095Z4C7_9BURK|nr:DUF551 domain-containing protein [Oligella urethralis]KGF29191.1 hypothetical protein HMPREF2130_09025 [Oligella urethralis DNF00040]OFS84516.1 hypothetical protein HMPREF3144_06630 [Oligella sp. HMSC05A10]